METEEKIIALTKSQYNATIEGAKKEAVREFKRDLLKLLGVFDLND